MSRRTTSDEERELFARIIKEARPIKIGGPKVEKKKKAVAIVPGGSGVNGATEERLKKGLLEPQARIDLHGMTEGSAHRALFAFLAMAQQRGLRLVLVVTGKGNPKNGDDAPWMRSPHGVLKQMVPRWLNEPTLAALIASSRAAHVRHGGDGALYVYMRK
jgi:DNA-nicking Smr family endonuclease